MFHHYVGGHREEATLLDDGCGERCLVGASEHDGWVIGQQIGLGNYLMTVQEIEKVFLHKLVTFVKPVHSGCLGGCALNMEYWIELYKVHMTVSFATAQLAVRHQLKKPSRKKHPK